MSNPYDEGYAAYPKGGPNPHKFGSPGFNFWRWGWEAAWNESHYDFYDAGDIEDDE